MNFSDEYNNDINNNDINNNDINNNDINNNDINNNVHRSKSYPHNLSKNMEKEIKFRTVYIDFDKLFSDKLEVKNSPLVSEDVESD